MQVDSVFLDLAVSAIFNIGLQLKWPEFPALMSLAVLRFYAELNDFLPSERKQVAFVHEFSIRSSVKDIIESLGVPHTEVDLILANGESVNFSYHVENGDRISVYPVFESIDIGPVLRVRPDPLRTTKFVVDIHLGRLAAYLRMAGFDTLYEREATDETLAHLSSRENRILLTRDRGLLKRSLVTHGYCVRENFPRQQLAEVIRRFDLQSSAQPFCRCMRCNGLLELVSKESILEHLPFSIRQSHDEFRWCMTCGRVYWPGSHYQRMKTLYESLLNIAGR